MSWGCGASWVHSGPYNKVGGSVDPPPLVGVRRVEVWHCDGGCVTPSVSLHCEKKSEGDCSLKVGVLHCVARSRLSANLKAAARLELRFNCGRPQRAFIALAWIVSLILTHFRFFALALSLGGML